MSEMTPQKKAARDLMLREFERVGFRYDRYVEEQFELLQQRSSLEELWQLAGLGEPPAWRPRGMRAAG